MESNLKDLGWANGWLETPEIVRICRKLHHMTSEEDCPPWSCVTLITCEDCQYIYKIDSSG